MHLTTPQGESLDVEIADSFLARARGLLGRRGIQPSAGMLIRPSTSVHMFFMRFAIDVVYLDRDYRIVRIVHRLRPWRASRGGRGASMALELAAGSAERLGLAVGQQLTADPSSARA